MVCLTNSVGLDMVVLEKLQNRTTQTLATMARVMIDANFLSAGYAMFERNPIIGVMMISVWGALA